MLSSVLPGLRQVRTPLVVGSLVLVVGWLWLGPDRILSSPDASGVPGRIAALVAAVGPSVTLAAVGLTAYLIGSLITFYQWPLRIAATKEFANGRLRPLRWMREVTSWVGRKQQSSIDPMLTYEDLRNAGVMQRYLLEHTYTMLLRDARLAHPELSDESELADVVRFEPLDYDVINAALSLSATFDEHDYLAESLRIEDENLFQEYDRLRSETELRYSLLLPLAALSVTLSVLWSYWYLGILVLAAVIGRSAVRHERQMRRRIAMALEHGVIESPAMQSLQNLRREDIDHSHTDEDDHGQGNLMVEKHPFRGAVDRLRGRLSRPGE